MMEPVESLHLQANPPALEAALRRRDNCRAFTEQRERLAILRGAIGAPIRRRELVKSLGPGCRATAEPVLKQKCRTQDQRPFDTHPKAVLAHQNETAQGFMASQKIGELALHGAGLAWGSGPTETRRSSPCLCGDRIRPGRLHVANPAVECARAMHGVTGTWTARREPAARSLTDEWAQPKVWRTPC